MLLPEMSLAQAAEKYRSGEFIDLRLIRENSKRPFFAQIKTETGIYLYLAVCPSCSSDKLSFANWYQHAFLKEKLRYFCQTCGLDFPFKEFHLKMKSVL